MLHICILLKLSIYCHIFICPFTILCYAQSNLPKFIISLLNNRELLKIILFKVPLGNPKNLLRLKCLDI